MRKIWKGLMQSKIKLLSVLFAAVAVVCLTTTLVLNLTVQPAGNDPSSKPIGNPEAYYDNLAENNAIELKYLIFETHTATDAPNAKPDTPGTAGTWCMGIDVQKINTDTGGGLLNYIQTHSALIFPSTTDGYDTVVGIDFSGIGWNNANVGIGNTFLQVATFIEVVKIPKSVKYVTIGSFNNFSKLGYFETPFIGTARGSSARGINMTAYDVTQFEGEFGKIPTSDPFGSMFGKHDPIYPMAASRTGQGDTSYWYDGINEPRYMKWKEIDEKSGKTQFYGYYLPDKIDYLYITDETALGNYSLCMTSARHVEVTAQGSVFSFGAYAFAESGKLAGEDKTAEQGLVSIKLNMSGSISMKTGTFDKCETLESIIIPRASTNIEIPDAFLNQALSLKTVYIPGTVTSIGKGAFKACEQLERIAVYTGNSADLTGDYDTDAANNKVIKSSYQFDLPTGLKSIGADAFADCKSFDTIYVPNAVESIGYAAYSGCSNVEKVILPFVGAHVGRCTGSCVNEEGKKVHHGLFGWIFGDTAGNDSCYDAKQSFIDETGSLASKPFSIPKKLKEITLTKETYLTTGCFQGLASLESVTVNDAVGSNIVEGCFDQCGSLQRMTIPAIVGGNLGAFFKGSEKFDGSAITVGSCRVPTTLKIVRITNMPAASGQLFHNCSSIETVEFSDKTTSFGHAIFYNNQSLKNLTVPIVGMQQGEYENVHMWWRDERYRNSLMWLFSESLQTDAYTNTSQQYWPYTNTVYYRPYIPNSLKSVTVTNETEIDYYAFRGFTGLENISITNVPGHIDEGSFWNCGKLQSLQLPYIGANLNKSGDSGWSHVLGYIFGRNASYGNSYAVSQYSTYYIPNGLETVEIGTASTEVASLSTKVFDYAFSGCSSIRSIDFKHADIQTLGNYAFANCSKLEDLNYPNARYSHVGNYAFYNCKTLKRMKKIGDGPDEKGFIPDTVKTIGNHAFDGTSVGYLDSGAYADNRLDLTSYTSVGDYAFANCLQIDEVTVPENLAIGSGLFAGCSYLTKATLPTNNKKVTPYMFQNCISLPGIDITGITNIPAGIFSGCTNLSFATGLQLNLSINSFGAYSFANCSSLEHFELPAGLYSIDEGAFQGCKNLEFLTIPRETKVINPYGWNNCDDNFYFYVYEPEEKWPSTWVYNWNCYYPVYVLGDVGEDVFTYTYVISEKRYYITGITKKGYDMGLSGTLRIPSRHDGVDVVGIDESLLSEEDKADGAQKIATQTGITRVILPKGVTKIVGSPFQTGQRIDIYTEYTKAEMLKIYSDSVTALENEYLEWEKTQVKPIPEDISANKRVDIYRKLVGWKPFEENSDGICMSDGSGESWDTRNWTSGGMLYYKDYWQYGTETGTSSLVPYLKINTFKYTFDEYEVENTSYTGSPIKVRVVRIELPGEIFINEGLGITIDEIMYIYESDVKILNYAYSNNVNVGTANVAVSINNDELEYYNENQWGARAKHPLYLTGTTTLHYQILPIEILLRASANDGDFYEKEYDGNVFSFYQWQSGQISGLEGYAGAAFSGTLSTRSANAGEYYPYDLVWTTPWRVMLNNIDVTKNFRVTVQFFVNITPMEVEVVWTRAKNPVDGHYLLAELSTATRPDGSPIYLYPYIGGEIQPTAVAKKYGTDAEFVPGCDLIVNHISNSGIYPYEKDGFQNTYHMYAYVAPYDANNYVIRATDRDTGEKYIPQVTLNATTRIVAMEGWYRVTKGRIVISFDLSEQNAFLISPEANEWSYTWGSKYLGNGQYEDMDNRLYISGLGENSHFVGKMATSSDTKATYDYNNALTGNILFEESGSNVYVLSWQTISFAHSWNGKTINYTATADMPFLIWNPILDIENENDCYDVIVDGRVQIVYNQFEPTFFIGLNTEDFDTVKNPNYITIPNGKKYKDVTSESGSESQREYLYWEYEVDGSEYRFSAEDLSVLAKNVPGYAKLYHTDNGASLTETDVKFVDLGDHIFSVTFTARHYDDIQYNIWINAVRSHVRIADLSKVYDRKPVDIDSKIIKMGADQRPLMTVTYMDQYGTELTEPPVNVGRYKAHIVVPEGEFFHPFDEVIDYEITARVVTIDVSGNKVFDNQPHQIDALSLDNLGTAVQGKDKGLLDGDRMQGILQTTSFVPRIYDSALSNTFKWAAPWIVVYIGTYDDVSRNYRVELTGAFEIKPLQFKYNVRDDRGNLITDRDDENHLIQTLLYDSTFHSISINLTYPVPGNFAPAPGSDVIIRYSDVSLSENSGSWLTSPSPVTTPGKHKIYYMLKADYFETIIDYVTIDIKELTIVYEDPAWNDGDGFDDRYTIEYSGGNQTYMITVIKPSFSATVYYSVDGGPETEEAPMFKEVGEYTVKYRITAPNYEEVINTVIVHMVQPGEEIPTDYYEFEYFNGVYDGNEHSVTANFKSSFINSQPAGFWYKVLFSVDQGKNWTEVAPKYTEVGKYRVDIKYQAKGYRDVVIAGQIIIKGKPLYLETTEYEGVFDGKYHNAGITTYHAGCSVTYDEETGIYTYTDASGSVELNLLYSLNANVAAEDAKDGWISGPGFKNVGLYTVYVKVEAENYEPTIFTTYTPVTIKFLENPSASMESPQTFEYSKKPLEVSQIEIDTVADGVRTAYWYSAHYGLDGEPVQDLPEERITAPQELGIYYVKIHISPTKNTGAADVEGFVEIVPRKLTVMWDSPQYYDGNIKTPNATVETGTTDEISLMYEVIGAIPPIEVGSYDFNVWMAYPNPNYVLDRDQFTLEIIKRNVLFNLHEDFVVKDDFSKWVYTDSPSYDKSDQCPGDDHWHLLGDLHGTAEKYVDDKLVETTYSGLAPNHLFYIEMETSSGQRGQYHYSTITNDFYINSVRVIKWDIYEKDENNNIRMLYGEPVSVKEFYDVDFDILISLTYPQIDLSSLEIITDYVYDGLAHTIYINIPTKYGSAYIYYKDDSGRYTTSPPRRTFVGEYPVEYYVGATGYEETYGKTTLRITPADLYITIGDLYKVGDVTKTLHEKYDATKHINSYGVTNIKTDVPPTPTHIRYYDATVYKEKEILDLYNNFDNTNSIYAAGLENLIDAGKYYCVVYYAEDGNRWHESFAMKYVELKPRNIMVEFAPGSVPDIRITYNGNPVVIPLTNATIDTTPAAAGDTDGLLPIHSITTTAERMKEYYVQTNGANAGVYPLDTGFDFLAIDIYEIAGHRPVKVSNYHPVLVGDFHVEILKKYLEDDEFYLLLDEYVKTYDGLVHTPDYFPKDAYLCVSDGEMDMTFYQIDNDGTQTYVPGDQKNAGTYRVVLGIGEGTNYYSSYASNAQPKADGTPYLSYPTVEYIARVSKKVVDVTWYDLEQTFNGEILYPRPTFIDAETDPGNEVEVDLVALYYDSDVYDFIPKNIINAGDFLVAAKFDTSTIAGKDYEKNYTLSRSTVSEMFIVNKLVLALQLGDGGNTNKITHYSSQAPWQTTVHTTPIVGAAEFVAEGNVDIQTWINNMKISSLADDLAPARVSTISYAETTYADPTDFVYDIRIRNKAGLDVTDSIDYKILGSVTIVADEIVYDLKDHITVMYREIKGTSTVVGYNLNELNCLTVYNPARYNIANYRIDGEIHSENDRISQAGDYVLTFDITAENRITRSCTVYVTIQKRTAYMIFKEELTKTYDGVPVDVAKLINSNLSGFNGTMSDLQFQYVEIVDAFTEIPLNTAPKAVGNYRVDIISKADENPSAAHNYTILEVSQTFSIFPREININYEKDLELLDDEPLGKPWRDAYEALAGDITDIVSGDKLFYEFNLASLARGEFIARRTFKESKDQTQQSFTSDNDVEFTFAWAVKQTDDRGNVLYEEFESPPGSGTMVQQAIDISKNYKINLSFRLIVHYPYIPANIIGEEVTYDGEAHHGTITFEDDKAGRYTSAWYESNVLQTYSTDLNTLSTSTIHNINDLSFTEPGTYTVYYKLTIDPTLTPVKYEDKEGSFNIVINKLERNLVITQTDKDYDGKAAGVKLSGTTTERYFPEHTLTLPMPTVPDNYDLDDVILTYSLGGKESVNPADGCIEAGVYDFTLIFPETAYYKQTKISSHFQIRKIKIYIEDDSLLGGATFSYDNLVKTYDFTFNKNSASQSEHNNYMIYTMEDGILTELQDQNLLFRATLITNNKEVGSYHGNDGSLTVFAYEYEVFNTEQNRDMTHNYMLDIAHASINIENVDMVWSTTPAEYVYDGQLHGFNISFAAPSKSQVTIKYKNDATGDFQVTPIQYRDCGEYEVEVELSAKNYNTTYGKLKLTIKRAPTEIIYVTNLGKIYDGAEVTLPDRVFTNRDLADEENLRNSYTYEYYQYNSDGELIPNPMYRQWLDVGGGKNGEDVVRYEGTRPIDVGKYKIKIIIPPVKNFDGVEWETDFRISQRDATLNWKGSEFIYDGTAKSPEANMVLTADDVKNSVVIKLKITIVPNGDPNDDEHKSVGFYTAIAEIDYENSTPKAKAANYKIDKASESFPFRINPRRIAVVFSRKDVLDTYPYQQQYNIRYRNSTSYNPETKYSFDVQNLVSTHEMKDYLQLKYAGTKTYFNITDFQWMDFQTNTPIGAGVNPKIYDENDNEVQNNYLIETYQVLFGLTKDESAIEREIRENVVEYDGELHTFIFEMENKNDFLIFYKVGGKLGTGNNYVISSDFPGDQPSFREVGYYPVNVSIRDLSNKEIVNDLTYIEIYRANPHLEPTDLDFRLGKVYDGKPVDNPEMDYDGKVAGENILQYIYYKITEDDPDHPIQLAEAPKEVGKYKLVVKIPERGNYAAATYSESFIFEITPRHMKVVIPSNIGRKLYDGMPWTAPMNDTNIDGSGDEGLAPNQTIRTQELRLNAVNARQYNPNGTDHDLFKWTPAGTNICKVYDENGREVQQNYTIEYVGYVDILQRQFAFEFDPLVTKFDANNTQGYFVAVKILGTYDENGDVAPTYIQNDDIQIIYSFNEDFSNSSTNTPLPVKKLGHTLVWAKIVDKTGNIASATTYTMVYLYEDKGGEDDPDTPIDGPTDAENDPEHIKFEKFKTYNEEPYEWPQWLGSTTGRTFETTFYTLEYWKQCQADGVDLDPNKAIPRPIDIGEYVFDYRVSKDPSDPEDEDRRYLQAFRVKPNYVSAIWSDLIAYIPDGEIQLENPTLPGAKFITAKGELKDLEVGPLPGYVSEGLYTVNATIPNNEKGNYILKNPGNIFEITADKDKKPKPNDAELRDDITFKKDKVFDTKPYPTPEFTGHNADNRTTTVKYYDWDYYQENYPDLDPSKAIDDPTDTGKYVFVMDISEDPDDPDGHPAEQVHQYFTVSPHPVEVTWSDLEHNFDGTMKYAHAEFKGVGSEKDNVFVCEVVPGYDYVGDALPVLAKTPNKNYTITNPNANMRIIGTVIEDIVIAPGQEFKFDDPIILKDTSATPNYYVSKDDYDKDNSILDALGDLSHVFIVDNDGIIYEWDPVYGQWKEKDVPYKMHIDVNRDAGTHKVTMELKDKTQYSWKNHGTDDIEETYEIDALVLPDADYDLEYVYEKAWQYNDGKPIEPPVEVFIVDRITKIRTQLTSDQYKLSYNNNTEPTTEAEIIIEGQGNYSFNTVQLFTITKTLRILELLPTAKVAWNTIKYEAGMITTMGEGNDPTDVVEHKSTADMDLYLGCIHHQTKIEDILQQFKNYAEHPEWFIVRRFAGSDEEADYVDKNDATKQYVDIGTEFYQGFFGSGYTIFLVDEETGDVLDQVAGVVYGDLDGDGLITASDADKIDTFTGLENGTIDDFDQTCFYFAGIMPRDVGYITSSASDLITSYLANIEYTDTPDDYDFNLFGGKYQAKDFIDNA